MSRTYNKVTRSQFVAHAKDYTEQLTINNFRYGLTQKHMKNKCAGSLRVELDYIEQMFNISDEVLFNHMKQCRLKGISSKLWTMARINNYAGSPYAYRTIQQIIKDNLQLSVDGVNYQIDNYCFTNILLTLLDIKKVLNNGKYISDYDFFKHLLCLECGEKPLKVDANISTNVIGKVDFISSFVWVDRTEVTMLGGGVKRLEYDEILLIDINYPSIEYLLKDEIHKNKLLNDTKDPHKILIEKNKTTKYINNVRKVVVK